MIEKENLNEYQKPKILESLESHNAKFTSKFVAKGNGIACPNCGKELYDSNPLIMLTSFPAKYAIHCKNCNYVGTRF